MGQVQVLAIPEVLPQTCCVCGSGRTDDGRKYIDTGLSLDHYGVVYFCTLCLNQIVRQVGTFVPIEEYKSLEQWVVFYRDKSEILTQKVGVLNDLVNNVDFLRSINDRIINTSDSRPSGQEPTDEQIIELPREDDNSEGFTDKQFDGQDSSGRPKIVSSPSSS